MELRHLYKLSEIIHESIENGELPSDVKDDIEISAKFIPTTYYGIDKEFYYITHDNSYDGFVHSPELVTATVNGVKFRIEPKKHEED